MRKNGRGDYITSFRTQMWIRRTWPGFWGSRCHALYKHRGSIPTVADCQETPPRCSTKPSESHQKKKRKLEYINLRKIRKRCLVGHERSTVRWRKLRTVSH